jgi:hypothetical protein
LTNLDVSNNNNTSPFLQKKIQKQGRLEAS